MTAAENRPGLLEKLMAVVRAEFRVEVYVPDADDPVLGRPTSARSLIVTGPRIAEATGCARPRAAVAQRGRPAMAQFLADPGPPTLGRRALTACAVDGCRLRRHRHRVVLQASDGDWNRAGRPDPAAWAARPI